MRKKKSLPGDVTGDLPEVFQNNNMYAWEHFLNRTKVCTEKRQSPQEFLYIMVGVWPEGAICQYLVKLGAMP